MGISLETEKSVRTEEKKENGSNFIASFIAATGSGASIWGAEKALEIYKKPMLKELVNMAKENNHLFKEPVMSAAAKEGIKYADLKSPFDLILDDDALEFMSKQNNSFIGRIDNKLKKVKNKIIPLKIRGMMDKKFDKKINTMCNGENACSLAGKIYVNFDNISVASFHEMGHAKNFKENGLGKLLQKLRHPWIKKGMFATALAAAIVIPSKSEEAREEIKLNGNMAEKGAMFLKDNCVGIATLSYVPILAEEGLATAKGNKIAAKYLDQVKLDMVKKFNRKAWLSYLAAATVGTLGVYAADKIRNFAEC